MESELYSLLNNLLNPKKFPIALSLGLLFSVPTILEFFFIVRVLEFTDGVQLLIALESLSALLGYLYLILVVKNRIRKSLESSSSSHKEKQIYRLIGSFMAALYLLSPGFISFILGVILLSPILSGCIGRRVIRASHVDPSIIHTLLELNNAK